MANKVCKYCGQTLFDGKDCNCEDAKREKRTVKMIKNANASIDRIFAPEKAHGESVVVTNIFELLHKAVEIVANSPDFTVTVNFPGGVVKGVISSKKGKINIKRTKTEETASEIGE